MLSLGILLLNSAAAIFANQKYSNWRIRHCLGDFLVLTAMPICQVKIFKALQQFWCNKTNRLKPDYKRRFDTSWQRSLVGFPTRVPPRFSTQQAPTRLPLGSHRHSGCRGPQEGPSSSAGDAWHNELDRSITDTILTNSVGSRFDFVSFLSVCHVSHDICCFKSFQAKLFQMIWIQLWFGNQ